MEVEISKTFLFFGQAVLNLGIVIIALFLIGNLFKLAESLKQKTKFKIYFFDRMIILMTMGFSLLGFAIGLLVGLSLSPVVEVVIPALLTFYGGFLTYLFSRDSVKDTKKYSGIIISAMAVSFFLIYGVEIGSAERNAAIKSQKEFNLYYLEQEEAIKKKYK